MVHLEMSYLTHSKFSNTIIPDILPLFRASFRIFLMGFAIRILFRLRFEVIEHFNIPFLFRTRFGILHESVL